MSKKYTTANEVADLVEGQHLLDSQHSDARIKYLFNLDSKWANLGKCSLATGKWKYLTGYHYIIEINQDAWLRLNSEQKKALVKHELMHICSEIKGEEKKWKIKKHDVEEFVDIVKEFGCWNDDLRELKTII